MREVFGSIDRIDALLDVAALRHQVASGNLANVNTPHYTRRRVLFEEAMRRARGSSGGADPRQFTPEVVEDESGLTRLGGNNVVLEEEIALLRKNSLLYETFAKAHTFEKTVLRAALGGGG